MKTHKIAVKDFVTFLYSSGDLESQNQSRNRQKIGQLIHTEHQATYPSSAQKEVFVETHFSRGEYDFHLSGRIDGVFTEGNTVIIEEIKSTETDLSLISEKTFPAHLMQAKVYAYMYLMSQNLKSITVHLTYIHHPTKAQKVIKKRFLKTHLVQGFEQMIDRYIEWLELYEKHQEDKMVTLEGLTFPHADFREGQYHFMGAIYQTLMRNDILYATAPTGIGKTIGALFSGLKTLKNKQEKLFYLTAKNAGKSIAVETVDQLKANGLTIKAITLNSKENMCLRDEVDCDPDICPFAKGFYNRLRKALQDIFVHDDVYDAHLIKQYGEYHSICPHEFALEIANYSDIIICDYNYVFDPRIKLIRFFEESLYQPKLLIDEAHNLVDRSRSMYSSTLSLNEINALEEDLKHFKNAPMRSIQGLKRTMKELIEKTDVDKTLLFIDDIIPAELLNTVHVTLTKLDDLLQRHKKHPKRKALLDGYFLLVQFQRISEYFTEAFRFTIEKDEHDTRFNIVCLDASTPVAETIRESSKGTILFSATLSPKDYYQNLLTKGTGNYFDVPSPFDPKRLGLYVDVSTSTKYRDRTLSVTRIIDTIYAMLESKDGNYIAFFPSYAYMNMVLEQFDQSQYTVMKQTREMNHFERLTMIETFKSRQEGSKILFSVLGGSFSEGIDYVGDMLSGVLVVGVALPQYNKMNELLKDYFYEQGYNGYDFAYTFPGMNKVIQAVGRVIRTQKDKGIAILLDTRYHFGKYRQLMPDFWQPKFIQEDDYLSDALALFWRRVKDV